MADQNKPQRKVPYRPDPVDELDEFVLAFVGHEPSDEQQPDRGRLVMVRRLRMRGIPDSGEIFEQRNNRHVLKATLAQLPRIEWRHGDCRLDEVAEFGELRIS